MAHMKTIKEMHQFFWEKAIKLTHTTTTTFTTNNNTSYRQTTEAVREMYEVCRDYKLYLEDKLSFGRKSKLFS